MTVSIKLTTKDICEALGIGRHQLRSWTDSLKPYAIRKTKERSANRYDFGDLLFFAVIKHIHESLGVSIQFVAGFSESLYACVREPQSSASSSFVFANSQTLKCERSLPGEITQEGLLIDLQPAQIQVYKYLGLSVQHQTQLQFGLVKVN